MGRQNSIQHTLESISDQNSAERTCSAPRSDLNVIEESSWAERLFGITPQEISTGFVLFSARHKPDVLHSKWLSSFCFCWTGSFITSCQPGERDTSKERSMWQKRKCEKNNRKSFTKTEIWARLRRKCTARWKTALRCTSDGKRFYKRAKRNWR